MAVQFGNAYLTNATHFTSRERDMALDILTTVLHEASVEMRRNLALRLAQESGVPQKLVSALANDVIEVAAPVLERSNDLPEAELLDIVMRKTLQHRVAVARRSSMSEPVINALAASREAAVAQTLLGNIAIHIPEEALRLLAAEALNHPELGDNVARRAELTPAAAEHIYWLVSQELRAQINSRFEFDGNKLDRLLADMVSAAVKKQADPATRQDIAARLVGSGRVDAAMLIDILKNRGPELFRDLLGGLTKFQPEHVRLLCRPECSEPLALVCRALDISKTETASLLMLVADRVAGQTQFDPAALNAALLTYSRLTVGDARTVLWQWQSDPGYLLSLAERRST